MLPTPSTGIWHNALSERKTIRRGGERKNASPGTTQQKSEKMRLLERKTRQGSLGFNTWRTACQNCQKFSPLVITRSAALSKSQRRYVYAHGVYTRRLFFSSFHRLLQMIPLCVCCRRTYIPAGSPCAAFKYARWPSGADWALSSRPTDRGTREIFITTPEKSCWGMEVQASRGMPDNNFVLQRARILCMFARVHTPLIPCMRKVIIIFNARLTDCQPTCIILIVLDAGFRFAFAHFS